MRSVSGVRNRVVLTIAGVLALIAAAWLVIAFLGMAADWPAAERFFAHPDTSVATIADEHQGWLVPVAAVAAVLAVVAGLALLVAQVPTRPESTRLRLTDGDGVVLAALEPQVLGRALQERAAEIAGVVDADVHVIGAAAEIRLQAVVTVAEEAEISWSVDAVRDRLAEDVCTALGTQAEQIDVLLRLDSGARPSRAVAVADTDGVATRADEGSERSVQNASQT